MEGEHYVTLETEVGVMHLQTKEHQVASKHQKLGRILPQNLQREHDPANTFISDFWRPELWNNRLMLFWAIHFVAFCYSSSGNKYSQKHATNNARTQCWETTCMLTQQTQVEAEVAIGQWSSILVSEIQEIYLWQTCGLQNIEVLWDTYNV